MKIKNFSRLVLIGIFVLMFQMVFPQVNFALAACPPPAACPSGAICLQNPLCAASFEDIIDSVINFIFYVALAITPLMIIVAAFYYLTSAGDSGKLKTAKDIILYTVIGFAIILLSKGLVAMIKQVLGA